MSTQANRRGQRRWWLAASVVIVIVAGLWSPPRRRLARPLFGHAPGWVGAAPSRADHGMAHPALECEWISAAIGLAGCQTCACRYKHKLLGQL